MRKVKYLMAAAAVVLSGITLNSCLGDGDGNNNYADNYEAMTVDSYMGYTTLKGDVTGFTYYLANPEIIPAGAKRGFFGIRFDPNDYYAENKSEYSNVTVVDVVGYYYTKDFNNRPDTLKSYPVAQLGEPSLGGGYINIAAAIYSQSYFYELDMYAEKAGNDTLYAKFNYSVGGGDNAYDSQPCNCSFKLPARDELHELLQLKDSPDVVPDANDSIVVQIFAEGSNGETIKVKPFKVQLK